MKQVRFAETVGAMWIRDQLKDGPVSSAEMKQRAKRDGISRRALQIAANTAGVIWMRAGMQGVWLLPDTPATEKVAEAVQPVETAVPVSEPVPVPKPVPLPEPKPVEPVEKSQGTRISESLASSLRLPVELPSGLLAMVRPAACESCGSQSSFAWGRSVLCAPCARKIAA